MQKVYDVPWWRGPCMCSAQQPQGVEGGYLGSNPHQMEVSPLLLTVEGQKETKNGSFSFQFAALAYNV